VVAALHVTEVTDQEVMVEEGTEEWVEEVYSLPVVCLGITTKTYTRFRGELVPMMSLETEFCCLVLSALAV
jgi:hypothetical protein